MTYSIILFHRWYRVLKVQGEREPELQSQLNETLAQNRNPLQPWVWFTLFLEWPLSHRTIGNVDRKIFSGCAVRHADIERLVLACRLQNRQDPYKSSVVQLFWLFGIVVLADDIPSPGNTAGRSDSSTFATGFISSFLPLVSILVFLAAATPVVAKRLQLAVGHRLSYVVQDGISMQHKSSWSDATDPRSS